MLRGPKSSRPEPRTAPHALAALIRTPPRFTFGQVARCTGRFRIKSMRWAPNCADNDGDVDVVCGRIRAVVAKVSPSR